MARRATHAEQTAAKAISEVKSNFIAIGWGPMENDHHDLGTDLVMWVRDARLFDLGLIVGAQVKGGKSYFKEPQRDAQGEIVGWWYREAGRSHVDAWASSSVPHLLVLHDLDTGASYWAHVTAEAIVSTDRGAKVMVPKVNTVDKEHLGELMAVATSVRSRDSWEGSAWTESILVPPDSRWRYALIVPRLVAPHPNAGIDSGLSGPQALAMIAQVRLGELERISEKLAEVPSLEEAERSNSWAWRFVGAVAHYLLEDDVESLLARPADSPSAAAEASATVSGACALLDLGRPEEALTHIEQALGKDTVGPVDHAWLRMQQARICAEIGQVDQARAIAMEVLPLGATAGDDLTATALAGSAAALIFNTSNWEDRDVKEVIAAGDTFAGWWRAQMLSWGLDSIAERTFDSWTQNRSVTIGAEDAVNRQLSAVSLTANHAADHGGWRHARGLLGRDSLMRLDRHSEPDAAAAGLELLRIAGDAKAIKHASVKLAIDGPARALTLAAVKVHLESSTRTTAFADLTLLQRSGDLLDTETADGTVGWVLTTLDDPGPFAERTSPTFLLAPQLLETLAGVLPAASNELQNVVISHLVELPAQSNQVIATAWAKVARALPAELWSKDQARKIGERADTHNFALQMPLLGIASRSVPAIRDRLRRDVEDGSTRALAALGDVTDLPSDTVAGLIPKLADAVRRQITDARSGTHGMGDDIARTLTLLNMWHRGCADWEPLYEQLSDKAVLADHKRGAVALMGSAPERLPAEVKKRIGQIAVQIAGDPNQATSIFGDVPGLIGASVKLALSLGAMGEPQGREQLLQLLGGAAQERRWAAHAVAARSNPTESPLLIGLLQDPVADVRATAAGALAQLIARGEADDLTVRALRRALDDPGTWIAASVIGTLEAEPDLTPEAEKIVDQLCSHFSAHVRASATRRAAGDVA